MLKKLLIPLFLVTSASFVVISFMAQEYDRIGQALVREEQLDKDLSDADQVEIKRKALEEVYMTFPEDTDERLRVLLPTEVNPIRMMIDIEGVAQKQGIRLDKMAAETYPPAEGQILKATQTTFEILATYSQFKSFLYQLEKSLQLREPVSVTITRAQNNDLPGVLPMNQYLLKYESYSYNQE